MIEDNIYTHVRTYEIFENRNLFIVILFWHSKLLLWNISHLEKVGRPFQQNILNFGLRVTYGEHKLNTKTWFR